MKLWHEIKTTVKRWQQNSHKSNFHQSSKVECQFKFKVLRKEQKIAYSRKKEGICSKQEGFSSKQDAG
jgi:hypothetical protein